MESENQNKQEKFDYIIQTNANFDSSQIPEKLEDLKQGAGRNWMPKQVITLVVVIGIILVLLALAIVLPIKLIKKDDDKETPSVIDQYPDDVGGKTIYVFGHQSPDTDTVTSAIVMANFEKLIGNKNDVIPVRLGNLNKETMYALDYFGVEYPIEIDHAADADGGVMLVDHNQPSQGPEDIENCTVKKVVDHHALTGLTTVDPTFIMIKPVGSTQTVLYDLYKQYNVPISKEIAGMMLSGIISDTVLLNLPTTTKADADALKELGKIAGVDYNIYGLDMLIAGTDLSTYNETELLNLDAKTYDINTYKIRIAILNSNDPKVILERKAKLLEVMDEEIEKNNYDYFILSILDIFTLDSTALVGGEFGDQATQEAFGVTVEDRQAFLPQISSRKLQILPYLTRVFNSYPPKN